jgi:Peptidase family M28
MKITPFLLACTLFAADLAQEGERWWSHIQVLADDKMEGRNTGSPGHKRAALYVAEQFDNAGLLPAGTSGYLQPVEFNVTQIDEPRSSLAVAKKVNGTWKATPLKLGEDAMLMVREGLAPTIDAPAVFVGYGLAIPEAKYDDFAGLDLKGKILVYLAGGPANIPSALRAHYSSRSERWKAMEKAGAVGYVEIPNPKAMDIPWSRQALARFGPTMSLADAKFEEIHGLKFAARMNPDHADKILKDGGTPLSEILELVEAKLPLPKFPLNLNFRAKVAVKKSAVESQNVVGLLRGSDPKLVNEYVVFSAHLDHVGVGEPINGDKIYNGAMDDASGVASLIEIANMMKAQRSKPRRSILFLTVTGEEKGLLGSRYFSINPTVPKDAIVADINMDMFLPLFALKYLEVQGLGESTLGNDIREICQKAGIGVQADKEPDRNLFIRSDQYSFIRQGVPALAFKFGYDAGSPEEKTAKDWLKNRYHAPSDDLNQPVDKAAAAQFNHILLDLGTKVANAKDRPKWNENSFFKRFAAGS